MVSDSSFPASGLLRNSKSNDSHDRTLEFGPFRLHVSRRQLVRDGTVVPMVGKAFDTLLALVENRDRLITREELMKLVWPDSFVADGNLTQNISLVRKALGEGPAESRTLVTVARRGYRFVAAVSEVSADPSEARYRAVASLPSPSVSVTRLIVLPFRMLRPDDEIDFLSFSLADSVTSSLAELGALVVRSSLVAARFGNAVPDLALVARETDVDVVLTGTLLRSGEKLRVASQLVEMPGGALLWSRTDQVPLRDVFELEESLVKRIVEALALPLTARERRSLSKDVPANPRTFEFYLRATALAYDAKTWDVAMRLFEQCVAEDPGYAPAWARLGRLHRLTAKYGGDSRVGHLALSEAAFRKALELNPDLELAHNLYAQLELDQGLSRHSMVRLLSRLAMRRSDVELFAGLVTSLRFCGLLEASRLAAERALALDRDARTSLAYTRLLMGDYEAVAAAESDPLGPRGYALALLGRTEECLDHYRPHLEHPAPQIRAFARSMCTAVLPGPWRDVDTWPSEDETRDPEALYFGAMYYARVGRLEKAIRLLDLSVGRGFTSVDALERNPWLRSVRDVPEYARVLSRASAGQREAEDAFRVADGPRLLLHA